MEVASLLTVLDLCVFFPTIVMVYVQELREIVICESYKYSTIREGIVCYVDATFVLG